MQPSMFPLPFDASGNLILQGIHAPNSSWSIDQNGNATFQNLNTQTLLLAGQDVGTILANMPQGVVAGKFISGDSAATTAGGAANAQLYCIITIPNANGNRNYTLHNWFHIRPGATAQTQLSVVCYGRWGADPTLTTNDGEIFNFESPATTSAQDAVGSFEFTFQTNIANNGQDLHIGLFVYGSAAGVFHHSDAFSRAWITDDGFAALTGLWQTWTNNGTGGGSGPQQHVKTYSCTDSNSYQESGTSRRSIVGTDCYQGFFSSTNGNQFSAIAFNFTQIYSDISGASSIDKLELYVTNKHWYNNSGGTIEVGWSTISNVNQNVNYANFHPDLYSTGMSYGQASWLTLNNAIASALLAGNIQSICLGKGPTTSHTYYGFFAGFGSSGAPQLRVTYTK